MFGGRRKRKRGASACPQCGATNLVTDEETGAQVCGACGYIKQQLSQEVVEVNLDSLARVRGNIVQRKSPKKIQVETSQEQVARGQASSALFGRSDHHIYKDLPVPEHSSVMQAMNMLVSANQTTMNSIFELPRPQAQKVELYWRKYLHKLQEDKIPFLAGFSKTFATQYTKSRKQPITPRPLPCIVIYIVGLVVNQAELPVLPWDILQMYKFGVLPFTDTVHRLPQALHNKLRAVSVYFRRGIPMSVENFVTKMHQLAEYLNLKWFPKLTHHNQLLVAARFAERIQLVPISKIWPYLLNLYSEMDFQQAKLASIHIDIMAMLLVAISFVPNWWDKYVLDRVKSSKQPSKVLFDHLISNTNLVFKGKTESFFNFSTKHKLLEEAGSEEFWKYMEYLSTHVVAKAAVPNKIDSYLKGFVERGANSKSQQSTVSGSGNKLKASFEKLRSVKELKRIMSVSKLVEKNPDTKRYLEQFKCVKDLWKPFSRYNEMEEEQKLLLDLASVLLNCRNEDVLLLLRRIRRKVLISPRKEELIEKRLIRLKKITTRLSTRLTKNEKLFKCLHN